MKNFLTLLFFAINCCCFSQNYQIQFPNNNYIYTHTDNPIDIAYSGDSDDLELTSTQATITKNSINHYTIHTEKIGHIAIIIYNKKTEKTDTITIASKKLPLPIVKLSLESPKLSTKQMLIQSNSLKTENDALSCWDANNSYISFDVTVIKGAEIYNFTNQENKFSEAIKTLFTQLEKGDMVIFHHIKFNITPLQNEYLNNLVYKI